MYLVVYLARLKIAERWEMLGMTWRLVLREGV